MYRVDNDTNNGCVGYENISGDIDAIYHNEKHNVVTFSLPHVPEVSIFAADVPNMIKALEHMQKYLVDKGFV